MRASVHQPLSGDALHREGGAGRVIATELDGMVVSEIELVEMPLQMSLRNGVIGTVNPPL